MKGLVVLAACTVFAARAARAQERSPAVARDAAAELFREARRLIVDQGQPALGLQRCLEAHAMYPSQAAIARLGACYEWAGRRSEALGNYERAWRSTEGDEDARRFAGRAIERLTGAPPPAVPVLPAATPPNAPPETEPPAEPAHAQPPRAEPTVQATLATPATLGMPATPARPSRSRTWTWLTTGGALTSGVLAAVAGVWTVSLRSSLLADSDAEAQIRSGSLPPYGGDYDALQQRIRDGNALLDVLPNVALVAMGAAVTLGAIALYLWLTD